MRMNDLPNNMGRRLWPQREDRTCLYKKGGQKERAMGIGTCLMAVGEILRKIFPEDTNPESKMEHGCSERNSGCGVWEDWDEKRIYLLTLRWGYCIWCRNHPYISIACMGSFRLESRLMKEMIHEKIFSRCFRNPWIWWKWFEERVGLALDVVKNNEK